MAETTVPPVRQIRFDMLTLSVLGLATIILLGLFAPLLAPHDPNFTNLLARNTPPFWMEGGRWDHPLGTDNIGRDLLSRCLYGIRTSFGIAAIGLIFSAFLGIGLGLLSGLGGPWVDRIVMTITDVFITLPNLLLLLCGIALLGTDIWVLVVMIGLVRWEAYARLVRGQVLSLRGQGYVEACRALGGGPLRVALLHVLPNLTSPLVVILTLSFPGVLLMEAGLSFLGVGVQPPTSSLGRMIGDGRDYLINAWWISGIPSIVIVAITLFFQLIGDSLRDRIDVYSDD
ncbi:MAG: ABC transporter permease [Pseudomonadota bacterium]